ncbi:type I-E CRISPR-associated protein Cas5/CasD [Pseudoclavibacter chungangensis]|uniref:Type I-E CRISPR-associated protein Cas5/CasD n=1 Tax=Pseudoclavibacter chungangensis TaxID=587635 RepID=A0A7J5C1R2_9MICO|nr:type I-E CRISPR-associated protein Cas5/CasD [Pseudoclavibacter chungangensis]KAB1662576.1 type I-E CRISPR-associated protein Cas5/CasD [Pseudoclavibacter chungangensis]NYJ68621.1 CRISPR system Cascade subunit CasD [Pseudoclavibacter chungangensis]
MSVLLLRLAGPLQAWGVSSRFERRDTRHEPSKSGVLGLVAAAQGRPRDAELDDLGLLRFGVRVDQEGTLLRDYQTARNPGWANPKLSYRYYLSDAVFVAGLEGERQLLDSIAGAIRSPEFPLYLGRRACPPSRPLVLDLVDQDLDAALSDAPWQAADWYCARRPGTVRLRTVRDARPGERGIESVRDVPVSFSPERREYVWRDVVESWVQVPGASTEVPDSDGSGGELVVDSATSDGSAVASDRPADVTAADMRASGPPSRPSRADAFDELI